MVFTLADIPENYELRLSDELVETLDRMNRPWLYNGSKTRGRNVIWRANESLFKRVWGWGRFNRNNEDNGTFITRSNLGEILNRTRVTYWEIEESIIGFRKGTCGRELKVKLPMKPDRWWAQLLGFYWSSGGFIIRTRGKTVEKHVRLNLDDSVIEMLDEIGEHIGDEPTKAKYRPIYKGPYKHKKLGSRVRQPIIFSSATFEVLKKFGMTTKPNTVGNIKSSANRLVNPTIPEWVKDDDDYSKAFIEGYINGQRGHSIMYNLGGRGISTQVLIRFVGYPESHVKVFGEFFRDWFQSRGVSGYFRKMPELKDKANRMPRYELVIHNIDGLNFLFENFEIKRPDMRARLILRRSFKEDYPLYEAVKYLCSVEIVTLGLIYEKPRTLDEMNFHLRIRPDRVKEILVELEAKGIIREEDGKFHVDLTKWISKAVHSNHVKAERLKDEIQEKSVTLHYQCVECGDISRKNICEKCGRETEPTVRKQILQPLVLRMNYTERKIWKLKPNK